MVFGTQRDEMEVVARTRLAPMQLGAVVQKYLSTASSDGRALPNCLGARSQVS